MDLKNIKYKFLLICFFQLFYLNFKTNENYKKKTLKYNRLFKRVTINNKLFCV